MQPNPPDEFLVYQALQHEFSTGRPAPSNLKKIRKRVRRHGDLAEVKALIERYNIDSICQVAKRLLGQGVYHSKLIAKNRFPEHLEVSPARGVKGAAPVAQTARCEINVLKDVSQGQFENGVASYYDAQAPTVADLREEGQYHHHCARRYFSFITNLVEKIRKDVPEDDVLFLTLYPVYLPLKTQHILLVQVQVLLENVCYNFGRKMMPSTLEAKGWDCAEAVELNAWSNLLVAHKQKFILKEVARTDKPFEALLESVSDLRHTAVHRRRVTVTGVEQFPVDAESLCNLMQDKKHSQLIASLRHKLQSTVEDMRCNRALLQARLTAKRTKYGMWKKELEILERAAVADMLRNDYNYQRAAGRMFEQQLHERDGGSTPVVEGADSDCTYLESDSEGDEVD